MSSNLILVLAVILAYYGIVLIFRRERLSLLVGLEYLFIGMIMSRFQLETGSIKPLIFPFLCWIGLLCGVQLKFSYLRGLSHEFYTSVLLYVLIMITALGGLSVLLQSGERAGIMAIAFASICYRTAAHFLSSTKQPERFILFFISFLPFLSILMLALLYLLTSSGQSSLIMVLLMVLSAILSRFLLVLCEHRDSVFLFLIGIVVFVSEICAVFTVSPLVIGFFTGIYLTNFSVWKEEIFLTVYRDEKPLYMLFLILLGLLAGLTVTADIVIEILITVTMVTTVKAMAVRIKSLRLSGFNWFYFLAPGAFSIALIADYWMKSGGQSKTEWLSVMLFSVVILQFLGVFFSRQASP